MHEGHVLEHRRGLVLAHVRLLHQAVDGIGGVVRLVLERAAQGSAGHGAPTRAGLFHSAGAGARVRPPASACRRLSQLSGSCSGRRIFPRARLTGSGPTFRSRGLSARVWRVANSTTARSVRSGLRRASSPGPSSAGDTGCVSADAASIGVRCPASTCSAVRREHRPGSSTWFVAEVLADEGVRRAVAQPCLEFADSRSPLARCGIGPFLSTATGARRRMREPCKSLLIMGLWLVDTLARIANFSGPADRGRASRSSEESCVPAHRR